MTSNDEYMDILYWKKMDKLVPAYDERNTAMEDELIAIGEPAISSLRIAQKFKSGKTPLDKGKTKRENDPS